MIFSEGANEKNYLNVYDMDRFDDFDKIYAEYFSENPPARTCIQAGRLPFDIYPDHAVEFYYDSKTLDATLVSRRIGKSHDDFNGMIRDY